MGSCWEDRAPRAPITFPPERFLEECYEADADDRVWESIGEEMGGRVSRRELIEEAFDDSSKLAKTLAVVVLQGGEIVEERYAGEVRRFDGSVERVGAETLLPGWSIAKSVLHALVGILVGDGRVCVESRAEVPGWESSGDPRREITVQDLLEMRDGLSFVEDYEDEGTSDVIEMLFGRGREDVSRFASDRGMIAGAGERFNYSSGSTNVLSGIVARIVGPGRAYAKFLTSRLLEPIGMISATPGFDAAGTWVASSFLDATAREFARFGSLYLNDGWAGGVRILPEGWVETARRPRSIDESDGSHYSWQWWVECDGRETIRCAGYGGQSITVCPALDVVMVRLGDTPSGRYSELARWREQMLESF